MTASIGLGVAAPSHAAPAPSSISAQVASRVAVPMTTLSDPFTKKVHDLMNAERAKVGARPLAYNDKIAAVSQDWANQISAKTMNGTFDFAKIHRPDAGGSLIPPGYTGYRENVGFNFTPEQIVDWWMNSPGHRDAMLNKNLTDGGLGVAIPTSGPYAGWHLVVSNMAAYPNTPIPTTPPSTGGTVTAGTQYKTTLILNMRSGGGLEYPVIGSGPLGTVVTATGRTNGIWYEVKMGSLTGWMSSDYLVKYGDTPATQTPLAVKAAQVGGGLGAATGPEVYGLKDGGAYRMYERGAIMYSPATGAYVSMGAIRTTWASTGFESGTLGYPTSDEVGGLKNGGVYQNYQGGAIIWSPSTGAQVSTGPIRNAWAASGYEAGELGYPVGGIVTGLAGGGSYQNYQGGSILYSPASGAFISKGAIRTTWASTGYEGGSLGYPTSNEYKVEGGVAQNYQRGVITHNFTLGNQIVNNDMAARYKEHSAFLGTAVGAKVAIKNGGYYQNFVRGSILWSPASGAQISIGGTRTVWGSTGFENGVLGYPTSGEIAAGGGVYQNYQNGVITWHLSQGAWFVFGGIGSMYKDAGGAGGRLGLATSGEIVKGGGNVSQNFQNGTINWGPAGYSVTYK